MTTALELACDDSLNRFRAWLKAQNLPITPQRISIAAVVLGADRPLAADEVVARLRAVGPAPGTATVYRTIDVLMQCGLVVEQDEREGFRRFAPVRDDVSAHELLCTACGNVRRSVDPALAVRADALADALANDHGFVAIRHRLVVYGLCALCAVERDRTSDRTPSREAR